MTTVKNLMKKPPFFIMDFKSPYQVLQRHKYFWSANFWQWHDGPFNIFEICTEMRFIFLFFLNERNIKTWPSCPICYFVFLDFLFMFFFDEAFVKNFQNLFQDLVYYRILGCQTLEMAALLSIRQNLKKRLLFRFEIGSFWHIFGKTKLRKF